MKVGKPTSKRQPVRLRHKIQKASAAKQRKNKRLAKKDPTWRTKLKKDPGIPNLFPYKEKLLQEIEEKKRVKEELAEQKKQLARSLQSRGKNSTSIEGGMSDGDEDAEELYDEEEEDDVDGAEGMDMDEDEGLNPMAALLASARARAQEYEGHDNQNDAMRDEDEDEDDWNGIDNDDMQARSALKKDSSRKSFDKIFKEVVDMADVVLYVLDARDPEGTRSREVERSIMTAAGGDKRLILILNKIDLVPPPVVKGWLTHLRRYFPTLPLRASNPASNAKTFDHKQMTVKGTSEALFRALKSYAQTKQLKRAISVGVIGYPNVGKSSVINALSSRLGGRGGACPVGAEAGVTTSKREVKLDNKLKLIDSPGIVFPSERAVGSKLSKAEQQARLVLLNAVPPREMDDQVPAVKLLLQRLSSSPNLLAALYEGYGLPELMRQDGDDTLMDFLVQVARKKGRIGKGGIPSTQSAAQAVITDWRDGRIQGWMDPPGVSTTNGTATLKDAAPEGDEKIIVKEWAAEFKLDGLLDETPTADDDDDAMQS